ncbi:hypothetical protein ABZ330_13335 [Streptomyces sp. NPDC006172]|uniref:hypothetical protein n=1 Tax=Streptomyces sp. NPDC006172 TaxID=3154470 RepID=UPI0033D02366
MHTGPTADQITFVHEPLNISDNLGFGPVAHSCTDAQALSFWRLAERIVRPPGASAAGRDSLAFATVADQEVIVWRVTARDGMDRGSLRCHALFAPSGRLTARLALGLTGRDWSRRSQALDAGMGRTLDALDLDGLRREAADGADLLRAHAAEHADVLRHLVSWVLFEPGRHLSVAEAECVGDSPRPLVLLGLAEMLEPLVPGPWSFSTLEYEESGPYRLMIMPKWPTPGHSTHRRLRLHGQEPPADWAAEAARLLVARYAESGPQALELVNHPALRWSEMAPEERCRELLSLLRPRIGPGPASAPDGDERLPDDDGPDELPPADPTAAAHDDEGGEGGEAGDDTATASDAASPDDVPALPRGWPVREASDAGRTPARPSGRPGGGGTTPHEHQAAAFRPLLRHDDGAPTGPSDHPEAHHELQHNSGHDVPHDARHGADHDPRHDALHGAHHESSFVPAKRPSVLGHESFTAPAEPAAPPPDTMADQLPFSPAGLPPSVVHGAPAPPRARKGAWAQRRRRGEAAHAAEQRTDSRGEDGMRRGEAARPHGRPWQTGDAGGEGDVRRGRADAEWASGLGDMELVESATRCRTRDEAAALYDELEKRSARWDDATADAACGLAIIQGLGLTQPKSGPPRRVSVISPGHLHRLLVRRTVRRAEPARVWARFLQMHGWELPAELAELLRITLNDHDLQLDLVHPAFFTAYGPAAIERAHGLATASAERPAHRRRGEPARTHAARDSDDRFLAAVVLLVLITILVVLFMVLFNT